jgi:hypothetical protein
MAAATIAVGDQLRVRGLGGRSHIKRWGTVEAISAVQEQRVIMVRFAHSERHAFAAVPARAVPGRTWLILGMDSTGRSPLILTSERRR